MYDLIMFWYRTSTNEIEISNEKGGLITTISTGEQILSNDEVLVICQKWMDDRDLDDVEYKVFVEIH